MNYRRGHLLSAAEVKPVVGKPCTKRMLLLLLVQLQLQPPLLHLRALRNRLADVRNEAEPEQN